MFSLCTSCNQGFTGLTSFDRHFPPIVDGPKQLPCPDPASKGLERKGVRQYNGVTYPVWGMLAASGDSKGIPFTQGVRMDTLIRECSTCSLPFVKWGRGRPPAVCNRKGCDGKGEAFQTPVSNIGKYLDEHGSVVDTRTVAAPAAKAPKQPVAPNKPASAKPVSLAKAVLPPPPPPAYAQVPPPPPAVVDGKTLVEALLDGDLHPDTFVDAPWAEDAFPSLYPDPDDAGVIEPVFDDYMVSIGIDQPIRATSL